MKNSNIITIAIVLLISISTIGANYYLISNQNKQPNQTKNLQSTLTQDSESSNSTSTVGVVNSDSNSSQGNISQTKNIKFVNESKFRKTVNEINPENNNFIGVKGIITYKNLEDLDKFINGNDEGTAKVVNRSNIENSKDAQDYQTKLQTFNNLDNLINSKSLEH